MNWNYRAMWQAFRQWALARLKESSTWAGLAMIAVVMGSDPMRSYDIAEAISLIVGGGLIARPASARHDEQAGENS